MPKFGTFAAPASAGDQSIVTGGGVPKLLFIWSDGQRTSAGAGPPARLSFGVATGASEQQVLACESVDALGSSNANRHHDTSNIIRVLSDAVVADVATASLSSFDSDSGGGFTLNWSNVQDAGEARLFHYAAFSADDEIDTAKAGTFTSSGSTGNQGVTDPNFDPDLVMLFGNLSSSAGGSVHALFSLGAFDADLNQGAVGIDDEDNQTTTDSSRTQRTDRCFLLPFNGSIVQAASAVSMDALGFTVNWLTASARLMGYVAIKGTASARFKVASGLQKTSTGTQDYTGFGFQPHSFLAWSFCNAATTSLVDNARLTIGGASAPTERAASWFGSGHGAADSVADSAMSSAACLTMQTEGTPTENARADLDTFLPDGIRLDWEVADATARQFLLIAFGSVAAAPKGFTFLPGFFAPRYMPQRRYR